MGLGNVAYVDLDERSPRHGAINKDGGGRIHFIESDVPDNQFENLKGKRVSFQETNRAKPSDSRWSPYARVVKPI